MKKIIFFLLFINISFTQNKYPIVLIHGFFGWGNDEMGDYRYWGGKKDIQKIWIATWKNSNKTSDLDNKL